MHAMCVRGVYTLRSSGGTESSFKLYVYKRQVENRGSVCGSLVLESTAQLSGVSNIYVAPKTIYNYMPCVGRLPARGGVRGLDGGGGSEVDENIS